VAKLPPPEPLTLFGRPIRRGWWWTPALTWACVLLAGLAVDRGVAAALIPGGWKLYTGLTVATALAALLAVLFTSSPHWQAAARGYCLFVGAVGGLWTIAAVFWPLHTSTIAWWVWLGGLATAVILFYVARKDQYDYEFDELTGAVEAAEREAAALARAEAHHEEVDRPRTEADKWAEIFAKAGAPGVVLMRPERGREATRSGFALHLGLPDDGSVSFETLVSLTTKLEIIIGSRLDIPGGMKPGMVRITRAKNADGESLSTEVYLHLDVRDVLRKVLRLDQDKAGRDRSPLSVYKAFIVGYFIDGSPICLTLAEIHTLIVGQTRKGKSNLLNLIIRQLGRCFDVVLWVMDFKGGRLVRPWLLPWRDSVVDPFTGQKPIKPVIDAHTERPLDRPFIDWAATNLVECERMLLSAIALAKYRPNVTERSSGWTATRTHPAVFIAGDEMAEAAGEDGDDGDALTDSATGVTTTTIAKLMNRVLRLGAGEGVYFVGAQQRGTVTSGVRGDGKSQIGGRILLPVSSRSDASDVIEGGDEEIMRLCKTLKHPGSVVIDGFGHDDPMPGRLFLMAPKEEMADVVHREVVELTHLRPQLDPGSAAAIAPYGYATRWAGIDAGAVDADELDRIAWLWRRPPSRPLRRFSMPAQRKPGADAPAAAAAVATAERIGSSTAERYGLGDVESPFRPKPDPAAAAAAAGAAAAAEQMHAQQPEQAPPVDDQTAQARAEWEAIEAQLRDEMGHATPPAPPPIAAPIDPAAPPPYVPQFRQPDATFETVWRRIVEIVDGHPDGILAADVRKKLEEDGIRPKARNTINEWCNRLAREGQLVKPDGGALFVTPRNAG
jgi:hypothetical protein